MSDLRLLPGVERPTPVLVTKQAADQILDLALLTPSQPMTSTLTVSKKAWDVPVGTMVKTVGYPLGYNGTNGLLAVGYYSGVSPVPSGTRLLKRLYVDIAFNGGNSGGPLFLVDEPNVIFGVVSAKVAPLPAHIAQIVAAIRARPNERVYETTTPDGKKHAVTENDLLMVLVEHLHSQVQLGIGIAVGPDDLRDFLTKQGIEP